MRNAQVLGLLCLILGHITTGFISLIWFGFAVIYLVIFILEDVVNAKKK